MSAPTCRHCGRLISKNEPSGEWFHDVTAEKECDPGVRRSVYGFRPGPFASPVNNGVSLREAFDKGETE